MWKGRKQELKGEGIRGAKKEGGEEKRKREVDGEKGRKLEMGKEGEGEWK